MVGVTWKHFTETGAIRAKSVIIAAGGFVMNPAMVAEYTPKLAEKPFVLGSTYDDGLGIRLGVSAGRDPQHESNFRDSSRVSAVGTADRDHREQERGAVRLRGFLPFPDLWIRDGSGG